MYSNTLKINDKVFSDSFGSVLKKIQLSQDRAIFLHAQKKCATQMLSPTASHLSSCCFPPIKHCAKGPTPLPTSLKKDNLEEGQYDT